MLIYLFAGKSFMKIPDDSTILLIIGSSQEFILINFSTMLYAFQTVRRVMKPELDESRYTETLP